MLLRSIIIAHLHAFADTVVFMHSFSAKLLPLAIGGRCRWTGSEVLWPSIFAQLYCIVSSLLMLLLEIVVVVQGAVSKCERGIKKMALLSSHGRCAPRINLLHKSMSQAKGVQDLMSLRRAIFAFHLSLVL